MVPPSMVMSHPWCAPCQNLWVLLGCGQDRSHGQGISASLLLPSPACFPCVCSLFRIGSCLPSLWQVGVAQSWSNQPVAHFVRCCSLRTLRAGWHYTMNHYISPHLLTRLCARPLCSLSVVFSPQAEWEPHSLTAVNAGDVGSEGWATDKPQGPGRAQPPTGFLEPWSFAPPFNSICDFLPPFMLCSLKGIKTPPPAPHLNHPPYSLGRLQNIFSTSTPTGVKGPGEKTSD